MEFNWHLVLTLDRDFNILVWNVNYENILHFGLELGTDFKFSAGI